MPIQIPTNSSRIACISGGGAHSLLLAEDGALFSCGDNTSGQLGSGSTTSQSEGIHRVEAISGAFTDIAVSGSSPQAACIIGVHCMQAGPLHSVACSGGEVYTWGDACEGLLGHSFEDSQLSACQVILRIAACGFVRMA